jgi:hypothetical protein
MLQLNFNKEILLFESIENFLMKNNKYFKGYRHYKYELWKTQYMQLFSTIFYTQKI